MARGAQDNQDSKFPCGRRRDQTGPATPPFIVDLASRRWSVPSSSSYKYNIYSIKIVVGFQQERERTWHCWQQYCTLCTHLYSKASAVAAVGCSVLDYCIGGLGTKEGTSVIARAQHWRIDTNITDIQNTKAEGEKATEEKNTFI